MLQDHDPVAFVVAGQQTSGWEQVRILSEGVVSEEHDKWICILV